MPTLQQRLADSADPRTRRQAMQALSEFLRDDLDDLAMKKLWRSIFFAMWLADLPKVHDELARSVAKTVHRFGEDDAVRRWTLCFCATLAAEWARLDKYRLDKYYLLARHFVRESLAWCRAKDCAPASVDERMRPLLARREELFACVKRVSGTNRLTELKPSRDARQKPLLYAVDPASRYVHLPKSLPPSAR
mgnify:CR=1 FL=1